jgi:pantoate--beta-alanine ligase
MKVIETIPEMQELAAELKGSGQTGFVPTMGALHRGHLELVRAARKSCASVVVSVFVNPLQFAPSEDFEQYPRDQERDFSLLDAEGVDIVFFPSVKEMYPEGRSTTISVGNLGRVVEGAARPGHFDGVATVVAKLFNIVRPDVAFFGQKDAQQVAVIKRMVADLSIPVRVEVVETVRESDGLALSSRNQYLSPDERARSTALFGALQRGREILLSTRDPGAAEEGMGEILNAVPGLKIDYARAVDPITFEAPSSRAVLLVVAASIGRTRLIDNLLVEAD